MGNKYSGHQASTVREFLEDGDYVVEVLELAAGVSPLGKEYVGVKLEITEVIPFGEKAPEVGDTRTITSVKHATYPSYHFGFRKNLLMAVYNKTEAEFNALSESEVATMDRDVFDPPPRRASKAVGEMFRVKARSKLTRTNGKNLTTYEFLPL